MPISSFQFQRSVNACLMVKTRAVYGLRFDGVRYDIGNKLDFIKTNIIFGLKRDDMRADLLAFLREITGST